MLSECEMNNKKITALIVEDEVIIAQWLEMELEYANVAVKGVFSNGESCIEAVKNMDSDLDVILMDVNINGTLDGIETAIEILKIREVKFIFMTGFSVENIKERALMLEPVAFLTKPVVIEDLTQILDEIASNKELTIKTQ